MTETWKKRATECGVLETIEVDGETMTVKLDTGNSANACALHADSYEVKGKANRLSGVHPLLGNVVVERLSQDRWVWSLPDEAVRVELRRRSPQGVFQDLIIQAGREQVRLRFSELDITGDPPETELFRLTPPPGVTPQRL